MSIFDRLNGGNMQSQLQQIQRDPLGMARQAGYQIPENLAGNPQAMVQHLIQTGQVSNPLLQKIMPMMQRLGR
jgi:hypothetical protein